MDRGVVVVETFQPFTVDQVYRPYNCDILQVIMDEDGTLDQRVLSSTAGAMFGNPQRPEEYEQLARYFESPELQMATFTITEKGYALRNAAGELFPYVAKEIADGPAGARAPWASSRRCCWRATTPAPLPSRWSLRTTSPKTAADSATPCSRSPKVRLAAARCSRATSTTLWTMTA